MTKATATKQQSDNESNLNMNTDEYVQHAVRTSFRIGFERLHGFSEHRIPVYAHRGSFGVMRARDIEQMRNNELSHIGWLDLDNDYFVFWKRQDIAQAFSNLHDFGDVLSMQSELIDVSGSGQKLVVPDTREYWNAELATVTQQFADMESV